MVEIIEKMRRKPAWTKQMFLCGPVTGMWWRSSTSFLPLLSTRKEDGCHNKESVRLDDELLIEILCV